MSTTTKASTTNSRNRKFADSRTLRQRSPSGTFFTLNETDDDETDLPEASTAVAETECTPSASVRVSSVYSKYPVEGLNATGTARPSTVTVTVETPTASLANTRIE
jgi:hypothetical protein